MTDYKLPDLPSDDELGITDGDREEYEKNFPDDGPEMSDAEMAALLGDSPAPKKEPAKTTRREERKAAKEARREEKQRAKEAKSRAKKEKNEESRPKETKSGGEETDRAPEATAPAVTAAPRSRWRGPVTLGILIAIAVFGSSRTGLPRPVPANAPDTAFSSARAMAILVEVAREAHPPGSPEHARVREFLIDRLRSLGLEPDVQTTTSLTQRPGVVRAATVRNIVARIPGTASTGAVLITAHYDSREIAIGAADDGFGVVSIIEAVRALQAGQPLRNDVIVLLTDAEELGLLGARAFVDQHPWLADVSLALSVEMRGGGGPSIMFETNEQSGWVIRALAEFDSHPVANSISYEIYKRMSNDTDFTPFKEAGVQGLNFAAIDRANVYHQVYDRPENLSESTLQHHGIHALNALKYFGNADLSVVDAPNQVYFSLPLLGLVVYDKALALPLSGVLVVLFGVAVLLGVRAGARPGGLAAGLGVAVLAGALAFGSGVGLLTWLPSFHEEMGSLQGSAFHSEGWYMLVLACAAFVIVTVLTTVTQRWLSTIELALGALLVPLIGAVAMSFATPLAAMNFQWPVMAALLSVLALALLGSRREAMVGWIGALVLAAPVLVMMVWLTELLWLAMSLRLAGVLSVLMVVTLLLCLPALSALKHPNSWWAPLTGLVLGGLALAIGLFMSLPSAARPAPSTLVYAYEHGSGAAIWATSPSEDGPESEARAWAVERAGSPFAETRDLSAFGYRRGIVPVTSAPVVSAPPPQVILASDSIDENGRYVVLHVRSRIGAEMLRFEYDAQGSTRLVSLNGIAIDDPDGLRWADHWGDPDGDVVLELTMPANESIGLHIIEHLLRPEELLGEGAFTRPDDLAADISWMSDRAMFRYSVAAFVDPRHSIMLPSATQASAASDGAEEDTQEVTDSASVTLPDSSATMPDTSSVPLPDTSAAARDTASVSIPDTSATMPDTTSSRRDTISLLVGCADATTPRFEVPNWTGAWYKGNTHAHTTESDGDSSPEYVAQWYKDQGYDFLVLSDHNVLTDPSTLDHLTDSTFLLIPGEELTSGFEGAPIHVNGLNLPHVIEARTAESIVATLQANVDAIREVEGVPHINHPNFQWSFGAEELRQLEGDKLLEIWNGHPTVHNAGGGGAPGLEEIWDVLLTGGKTIYGIAVDDAHHFQGEFSVERANPGRGWIAIRAGALEPVALMTALEAGHFYASTGVELDALVVTVTRLEVHIRVDRDFKYETTFIGSAGRILGTTVENPAVFDLTTDEGYVRAKIRDSRGGVAWTQPVFVKTR